MPYYSPNQRSDGRAMPGHGRSYMRGGRFGNETDWKRPKIDDEKYPKIRLEYEDLDSGEMIRISGRFVRWQLSFLAEYLGEDSLDLVIWRRGKGNTLIPDAFISEKYLSKLPARPG